MSGPYEVIWETDDGESHYMTFPYEDHSLRKACDFCYGLKKIKNIVRGHVYDKYNKKTFASFDKTEDL